MVTESEFDKNQKAFVESQSQGAAQGGPLSGISKALGVPPERQTIAGLPDIPEILAGGQVGPESRLMLGGSVAGSAGQMAQQRLTRELIKWVSASALMGSAFSAFMSVPNSLIGKQVNTWAAEQGIDLNNLRLTAQEQLYTIPVEDPKNPGQWIFLDNDAERVKKRMLESGVPIDTVELRLTQLQQIRDANQELVQFAGAPNQLNLRPGELPFSGAQRLTTERAKAAEEGLKAPQVAREKIAASTQPLSQRMDFFRQQGIFDQAAANQIGAGNEFRQLQQELEAANVETSRTRQAAEEERAAAQQEQQKIASLRIVRQETAPEIPAQQPPQQLKSPLLP